MGTWGAAEVSLRVSQMLSVSSLTSQNAWSLFTDPGLRSPKTVPRRGHGTWEGGPEQYEGPKALCLPENSCVGDRTGDGSVVTFVEEDEAASIT